MRRWGWTVAAAALVLPLPATARAADWSATYRTESANDVVLESGETATSWFEYTNSGAQAWTPNIVRLGTAAPHDRASVMASPTWLGVNRVTPLDQASVAPGGIGRFTFVVQAPPVSAEQTFMEYFAPVADGFAWMDDGQVWLRYIVRPRVPPAVAFAAAPDGVVVGAPVAVSATASDNVRVTRVELRLGAGAPVAVTQPPYTATLSTAGLAPGAYPLTATAVDGVGQTATVTRTLTISAVPNGVGATRDVKLAAGFHGAARHTVAYGHADVVKGRLTTAAGAAIAGATLQVSTRVVLRGRGFRTLAPLVTGADGSFSYRAPRGPSRQIRFIYTAFAGDTQPAATRVVRMSTRAGVDLRAARHGGTVALSGRLRGGPKPKNGLLVVLQGRQDGYGWQTFRTARVTTGGRFSTRYRFRTASRGTFRFRATVREQLGYAYATGRSPVVSIRR